MLVSVRDFAAERLGASADQAEVERRHAQYFGALVESADLPAERQAEWAERMRTEEGNVRVAIRWFFNHDIAPLPHIFRVLWLYWQMRDRLPEGRAWIEELLLRADSMDDRAQAELWLTAAVTAVEVGDDVSALAAFEGIGELEGRIDDPYLECAAQLAFSWILPIVDDFEGSLRAATTALEGFRQQKEPFMALAALTVGILEMIFGRDDAARGYLVEANDLGVRFGNNLLQAAALTVLTAIEVRAGRLDEARALVVESLGPTEDTELCTIPVTFSLVGYAHIALADGDAQGAATALGAVDALRQRAGLRAWPIARRAEAELMARVVQAIESDAYDDAFAAGSELNHRGAVALVLRYGSSDRPIE